MVDATRRSVLARGLLALGGGAAGMLAVPGMARAASPSDLAPTVGRSELLLNGAGWQLIGTTPRLLATAGERLVLQGQLSDKRGREAGSFHADLTVVSALNRHSPGEVSTLESHVLTLAGGTITGSGTSDEAGQGVFAVTGGTGQWSGVRGSYTAVQNRRDLGGDGTARFVLTLLEKAGF